MLMTIAAAIFVLGLLVTVHELGHFATAKWTGMRVDEFAIGFGPKVWSVKRGDTVYSIRAIPLGGFNDIAGIDPSSEDTGGRGFCDKSIPARMLVIIAGSAMNFILPIFLFFGVIFFNGNAVPSNEPVFGQVIEDYPAAQAGLQAGDRVLELNGAPISTWREFSSGLDALDADQSVVIKYERAQQISEVTLTPVQEGSRKLIGVKSNSTITYPGFFESMTMAVGRTFEITAMMLTALVDLLSSPSEADVSGPIGIAQMAGQAASVGFASLINFAALLSLNLAIINMLPVPALDGGHFVTLILEALRGKPLTPKALMYTQRVGVVLMLLLMIVATKNDIVRVLHL